MDPLVIDRYVVLDTLGRGGMGIVYKALHKSMERVVALKCLPPNAVDSAEKVTRFQREVKAAASLSHPNIVTVFDAAECDGAYFLAMEFVDGQDLFSIVNQYGPLSINRAVQYIRDAAIGLQGAHGHGIIHRDIKPANLIVSSDDILKIADLGLATTESADAQPDQQLTQSGTVLGTIAYLSPEQAVEPFSIDARADIYSLGATFYFLLTGSPPLMTGPPFRLSLLTANERQPL